MAFKQSRIVELTKIISNNLPQPSFDVEGPGSLSLSSEMQDTREEVLNANLELQELLLGPKEVIADYQYNYFIAVQAVCQYGIASTFPVDGEKTFVDIAKACGLHEQQVRRIVRFAASHRIFKEVRKGVIVHTAFSKLLAEDTQFRDYCQIGGEDMWPSASKTVPAMLKWPGSEESNQSGFALAHDTDDSVYMYLSKHPEKAKRFASAMTVSLSGEGYDSKYVTEFGPWASIKENGTVVDIGGSNGDIMIAIAKAFPSLRFVVQDLQSQVNIAPAVPQEVAGRISMQAYDFFSPQPVHGADVYFFRWVFHNWADKYCLRILENLIPALAPNARVVLNEWCLPEPNSSANRWERRLRGMDLAMMTLQNSRERDRDDWIALFSQASKRFHLVGIQCPTGSQLSIIEFEWR
ncbi:O-methyltransferase [Lachnellula subtilissima]|uniref:O-methyltransferase n=1 Tax=Lachnellula subtilissima TaxID=602034 RepID=A0A8H8UE09_9HELO|nr:O-methyltransferase [Lachnellula subtilissima]